VWAPPSRPDPVVSPNYGAFPPTQKHCRTFGRAPRRSCEGSHVRASAEAPRRSLRASAEAPRVYMSAEAPRGPRILVSRCASCPAAPRGLRRLISPGPRPEGVTEGHQAPRVLRDSSRTNGHSRRDLQCPGQPAHSRSLLECPLDTRVPKVVMVAKRRHNGPSLGHMLTKPFDGPNWRMASME